jgi:hypothetical protein
MENIWKFKAVWLKNLLLSSSENFKSTLITFGNDSYVPWNFLEMPLKLLMLGMLLLKQKLKYVEYQDRNVLNHIT